MPAVFTLAQGTLLEFLTFGRDFVDNYDYLNVSHWLTTFVPVSPTDTIETARSALSDRWFNSIMPVLSSRYEYVQSQVKTVFDAGIAGQRAFWNYAQGVSTLNAGLGGVAGVRLPSYVTASAGYKTVLLSRNFRGGMRMGPVPAAYQDPAIPDRILPASLATLQAAVNGWRAPVILPGGAQLELVIASALFYFNVLGNTGPLAAACEPVISSPVNEWFGTQLSRKGPHVP